MSLQVVTFTNGKWGENCYIVAKESGDAFIIDPGSQADDIAALIDGNGWRVHAILNTHGHYDHVGAVAALKDRYEVPFYLHSADESLLKRANLYRMLFEAREMVKVPSVTQDISPLPERFDIGPFSVCWLGTPGHTDGSVCLQIENYLFSGDTLMHDAVGRTDLPGGNRERLQASIRKIAALRPDLNVCGGHGPMTTIDAEFTPGRRAWKLLQ